MSHRAELIDKRDTVGLRVQTEYERYNYVLSEVKKKTENCDKMLLWYINKFPSHPIPTEIYICRVDFFFFENLLREICMDFFFGFVLFAFYKNNKVECANCRIEKQRR